MANTEEQLRTFITPQIWEGFDSVPEIIENATDYAFETFGRDDLDAEIARITSELLIAHQIEQSGWELPTDCDCLNSAFAALTEQGIVARQHFSCCNTCGFREIWDEVEQEEEHREVSGYAFYHLQCTERAIETGQLLIAYGSADDNPGSLQKVANTIVAELRRAGLNASWQGTGEHPIIVNGIVWRRRRPAP